MPSLRACRRFAASLMFASPAVTAQAADVSPAQRVETTPGLSPDAIRKVFDSQRHTLAPCQRLVTYRLPEDGTPHHHEYRVWKPAPDTDDRLRVSFTLTPAGKLEAQPRTSQAANVQALYLDAPCVASRIQQWAFPTFPGNPDERVQVEVWARFRTTEAERSAALARMREDYTALCEAITPLSGDDRLPSPDAWRTALKRLPSERGPAWPPACAMAWRRCSPSTCETPPS